MANQLESSKSKSKRGFAAMTPEKQHEIASKGGRAAHAKGTAHKWNPKTAAVAGAKGGAVSRGGRGKLLQPADLASTSQE